MKQVKDYENENHCVPNKLDVPDKPEHDCKHDKLLHDKPENGCVDKLLGSRSSDNIRHKMTNFRKADTDTQHHLTVNNANTVNTKDVYCCSYNMWGEKEGGGNASNSNQAGENRVATTSIDPGAAGGGDSREGREIMVDLTAAFPCTDRVKNNTNRGAARGTGEGPINGSGKRTLEWGFLDNNIKPHEYIGTLDWGLQEREKPQEATVEVIWGG